MWALTTSRLTWAPTSDRTRIECAYMRRHRGIIRLESITTPETERTVRCVALASTVHWLAPRIPATKLLTNWARSSTKLAVAATTSIHRHNDSEPCGLGSLIYNTRGGPLLDFPSLCFRAFAGGSVEIEYFSIYWGHEAHASPLGIVCASVGVRFACMGGLVLVLTACLWLGQTMRMDEDTFWVVGTCGFFVVLPLPSALLLVCEPS
ncbi:hypothetical protein P168DRAFT_153894 [Aspergillus campestris IBT 28561]|uniref:Uncharacterized protein n=1 Tax=Aspergillus campestris (strain IBT 28561) TaxID=1392248 RepID=A0A2I1D2U3_ASPC2|nr:uncharacterized protein P168DRAFT_153894 [Aspergillus campestris IBT 28561]PKY04193.1 hypothetical protein P168DRAFT_153894 [Aspergillus campestris IBT 28561]